MRGWLTVVHVIEVGKAITMSRHHGRGLGQCQDRWGVLCQKIRPCRVGLHAAVVPNHAIIANALLLLGLFLAGAVVTTLPTIPRGET